MLRIRREQLAAMLMTATLLGSTCGAATAAVHVEGQAQAGGGPLANATVTLWAGSSSDPRQLAQTKTGTDGGFQLNSQENIGPDVILYLTAQGGAAAVNKSSGDNPAIAWLSVLGNTPPAKVVINEMTTVASVWTNAQFLDGTAIKGHRAWPPDRRRQRAELRRSSNRRLGRDNSGPAQQRPDANDGQLRDAGRRACRLAPRG